MAPRDGTTPSTIVQRAAYGFASSKAITRNVYDEICTAIERPGPLPETRG